MALEKYIESGCCGLVKSHGGLAIKLLGLKGIPDRLILLPGAKLFFVEFKRPGEKLRPAQQGWKHRLERLGFEIFVCDNKAYFQQILERFV